MADGIACMAYIIMTAIIRPISIISIIISVLTIFT